MLQLEPFIIGDVVLAVTHVPEKVPTPTFIGQHELYSMIWYKRAEWSLKGATVGLGRVLGGKEWAVQLRCIEFIYGRLKD